MMEYFHFEIHTTFSSMSINKSAVSSTFVTTPIPDPSESEVNAITIQKQRNLGLFTLEEVRRLTLK